MKKKSKVQKKDYSKLEGQPLSLEYFGVLMKDDRARIDTKRYKKFITLPDLKIEHRKTVYYIPTKRHRYDYMSNVFYDAAQDLKREWTQEYSRMIKAIKTPKEIESDSLVSNLADGVLEYDEACMASKYSSMKREGEYRLLVKSIYSQFFQLAMSKIDATILKVLTFNGYKNDKFSREDFDTFIQGKQGKEAKSFYDFENYHIYERAYRVWNFLKHNSIKAYNQLKKWHPEMIYDPDRKYQNGDSALSVLKLDEKFMLKALDELPLFFDEVCEKGFGENSKDARWDYDDYFIEQASDKIELIENPLGLPDFL